MTGPVAVFVPNYVAEDDRPAWAARVAEGSVDALCLDEDYKRRPSGGRWLCVLPKDHECPHG